MQQKQKVYVMEHGAREPNMVFEDLETLGATAVKMFGRFTDASRQAMRAVAEDKTEISLGGASLTCINEETGRKTTLLVFPATLTRSK